MTEFLEQPMPSAIEAEKLVLGMILIDNALISQALEFMGGDEFYAPFNRAVFKAMVELFNAGLTINPIAINEILKREGMSDNYGGIVAITQLTSGIPLLTSIAEYCEIIVKKHQARQAIKLCHKLQADLFGSEQTDKSLDEHEEGIFKLREKEMQTASTPFREVLRERSKHFALVASGEKKINDLLTGFNHWDLLTGGVNPADLVILAGRPGMGKTSLALDVGRNLLSQKTDRVVLFFSLEMSKEQLADKLICGEAKLNNTRFREGRLMLSEKDDYIRALQTLADYKLVIDDRPSLTTMEMKAKALRVKAEFKRLDAVVVDHVQLVRSAGETRALEVGKVSKDLKSLAKLLNAPVILLSQLSRKVETRRPPVPILSDLYESGGLEQDADQVVFIYRDEYYDSNSQDKGLAKIILAKNRHGPTGQFYLTFLDESATFRNSVSI